MDWNFDFQVISALLYILPPNNLRVIVIVCSYVFHRVDVSFLLFLTAGFEVQLDKHTESLDAGPAAGLLDFDVGIPDLDLLHVSVHVYVGAGVSAAH